VLEYDYGLLENTYPTMTSMPGFGSTLMAGDLDGDGIYEVFTGGAGVNYIEVVGAGVALVSTTGLTPEAAWPIGVSDLNVDGFPDFVMGLKPAQSNGNVVEVFHGNGTLSPDP